MMSVSEQIVKPEGQIRIETETHGIPAGATLYFVFDGDWCNAFEDVPVDE